jgi:outer membrane protein assembly factor BamA
MRKWLLLVFPCCICCISSIQFCYAQPAAPLTDTVFISTANNTPALVTIADIAITGNKKTKPYIIQREIPFKVGQFVLLTDLNDKLELCRQQLMNTALFVDVEVTVAKQQNELTFININVKERWYFFPLPYFKLIDRNFNQWWVEQKKSFDRVNYGLKFIQNNVSGRNDNLNIWLVSGYTQQLSFRYEHPFADKSLKHGFNTFFAYSRNREITYGTDAENKQAFFKQDDFVRTNIRAEATYSYRPKVKTRHYFKFTYNDEQVADTIVKLNPLFFSNAQNKSKFLDISYSMMYFGVDYIPYPLKGLTADVSLLKRIGLGSDIGIWQLRAKASYSKPITKTTNLYLQAAGMLSLPFDQPFYNKRMFGYGDLYMRGLEYYVVDGVAGFVGRATMRQEFLNFKLKTYLKSKRHDKIPFRIYAKIYSDIGYAYDKTNTPSPLNNKWLKTWGAGIDIITFYDIVLRFEYSFNQIGGEGLFFHTKSDF